MLIFHFKWEYEVVLAHVKGTHLPIVSSKVRVRLYSCKHFSSVPIAFFLPDRSPPEPSKLSILHLRFWYIARLLICHKVHWSESTKNKHKLMNLWRSPLESLFGSFERTGWTTCCKCRYLESTLWRKWRWRQWFQGLQSIEACCRFATLQAESSSSSIWCHLLSVSLK